MPFPEDLEWNQSGVEPTQAKKNEGWKPEEKPPAEYFNWFFNRVSQAVKYLKAESDKSSMQYWKASTHYALGAISRSSILNNSSKYFECTTAGTSGTTEPAWGAVGTTVTDGTVTWTIRDIRDARKLQTERKINGVNFDGSADIAITASAIPSAATGNVSSTNVQSAIAELETEKAPNSHASTATTYGVSTAANYGHAMASSTNPLMNGTASAGTDNGKFAREGHIHPTDTTRAALSSPTFTGTPTAPTAVAGTNTTQIASTAFVQTALSGIGGGIVGFNIAANGYIKFANGLIIQWGTFYISGNGTSYSFPIAFPNACFAFLCSGKDDSTTGTEVGNYSSLSKSGFVMNATFAANYHYIAIGN